jgi:hypothetical protein
MNIKIKATSITTSGTLKYSPAKPTTDINTASIEIIINA